jgi:hypothetical protein
MSRMYWSGPVSSAERPAIFGQPLPGCDSARDRGQPVRASSTRRAAAQMSRRTSPGPPGPVRTYDRLSMPFHHNPLEAGGGELVRRAAARAVDGNQPTTAIANIHRRLQRSQGIGTACPWPGPGCRGSPLGPRRQHHRITCETHHCEQEEPWMLTRAVRPLPAGSQARFLINLRGASSGGSGTFPHRTDDHPRGRAAPLTSRRNASELRYGAF